MKDYQTSINSIIWIGFRQGAHEYELQFIQNTSMHVPVCSLTVEIALDPFLVYINSFPLD